MDVESRIEVLLFLCDWNFLSHKTLCQDVRGSEKAEISICLICRVYRSRTYIKYP